MAYTKNMLLGDLVAAAFDEADRMTVDPRAADYIAKVTLAAILRRARWVGPDDPDTRAGLLLTQDDTATATSPQSP